MLALLEYFWDWDGAVTPPPSPVPDATSRDGGGGKRRKPYTSPTADFWDVRERYLRRFAAPLQKSIAPKEVIENDNETIPQSSDILADVPPGGGRELLLQQALAAALAAAHAATTSLALRTATARATQLALDISKLQQQHYNRAITLLLLDAF